MPKPRKRLRRFGRWLLLAALAGIVGSVLLVLLLRFVHPPVSAVMLEDWIGARLSGERDFALRHRWTAWKDVSPALPIALVAAEDQRFPQHHGFDFEAIQRAIAEADDGERLRGASTISQQVAKNVFLWNGRSFVRKGLEAWFTVLIEALWPKQCILEVYLNVAEFGPGIYGVGAASEIYFRIPPARLDARQSALLAAVLPNPARLHVDRPSPYVLRRAAWIQRQAIQLGGPAWLSY